jgi:hypothetical protein
MLPADQAGHEIEIETKAPRPCQLATRSLRQIPRLSREQFQQMPTRLFWLARGAAKTTKASVIGASVMSVCSACMQYEQGLALDAIAAEANATPEEVMGWFRKYKARQLSLYQPRYELCKNLRRRDRS